MRKEEMGICRRRVECREAINIKLMLGNERTIFKDVDLCNHKLSTQIDFILVSQVEFKYAALHTQKKMKKKKE